MLLFRLLLSDLEWKEKPSNKYTNPSSSTLKWFTVKCGNAPQWLTMTSRRKYRACRGNIGTSPDWIKTLAATSWRHTLWLLLFLIEASLSLDSLHLLKAEATQNPEEFKKKLSKQGHSAKNYSGLISPCSVLTVSSVNTQSPEKTRVHATSRGFCFARVWVYFSRKSLRVGLLLLSRCRLLSRLVRSPMDFYHFHIPVSQEEKGKTTCWMTRCGADLGRVGVPRLTAVRWISRVQTHLVNMSLEPAGGFQGCQLVIVHLLVQAGRGCDPVTVDTMYTDLCINTRICCICCYMWTSFVYLSCIVYLLAF